MRLIVSFTSLLAFVFGLIISGPQVSEAGALAVYLNENATVDESYTLIKDSDVDLINIYKASLISLTLVDMKNDERLATINELPAGQSVQINFGKVGIYQLTYKINSGKIEDVFKRLLIKVVNSSSA